MFSGLILSIGVAIIVVISSLLNVLYGYKRKSSVNFIVFEGIIIALLTTWLLTHFGIRNDSVADSWGVLAAFLYTACVLTFDKTIKNMVTDLRISRDLELRYQKSQKDN